MSRSKAAAVRQLAREAKTVALARGRNTLKVWMLDHHNELLAETQGRTIDWNSYLAGLSRRGLRDADGNPPTVTTAMQTWYRVRKAVASAQTRKQAANAAPPALAPGEIAPGVRATVQAAVAPHAETSLSISALQTPEPNPAAATQIPSTLAQSHVCDILPAVVEPVVFDIRPARPRGAPVAPIPVQTLVRSLPSLLSEDEVERRMDQLATRQGRPKIPPPEVL